MCNESKSIFKFEESLFVAQTEVAYICGATKLRVGLGQNGQILFISVEQLSLNVADDSAKTLSVLENMGGALDDCRLRFVLKYRRPPQNTPDFGGPTDFSVIFFFQN